MLPLDLNYIFEMIFYVNGFKESKRLTRKLVQLHQLCSEQLAHAEHYDFNIRTMKTILLHANHLKRKLNTLSELELLLKAILKVNASKLMEMDLKLFNGLCKQIFPDTVFEEIQSIECYIERTLLKQKLIPTERLMKKILQIYQMIEIKNGVIIVGNSLAGKSTGWQILADTLRDIKSNGNDLITDYDVAYRIINPKSISLAQLYGRIDPLTLEWCEGVLAKIFREMVNLTVTQQSRGWIVFDGIIDPLWVESLHTLLDDNRKLCLASGEMIEKTPLMSILFETDNLEFASPATVARCGIVYMELDEQQWKHSHLCFVDVLKCFELADIYISLFEMLVDWLVPAVLDILCGCNGVLSISAMQQYKVSSLEWQAELCFNELYRYFLDFQ